MKLRVSNETTGEQSQLHLVICPRALWAETFCGHKPQTRFQHFPDASLSIWALKEPMLDSEYYSPDLDGASSDLGVGSKPN